MAASAKVLGEAIRKLGIAPSTEWISGFDAGYDATIVVVKKVLETCDLSMKRCEEIRKHLTDASRTVAYLEEAIGQTRWPVAHKSFVSEDLK